MSFTEIVDLIFRIAIFLMIVAYAVSEHVFTKVKKEYAGYRTQALVFLLAGLLCVLYRLDKIEENQEEIIESLIVDISNGVVEINDVLDKEE